MSAPSKKSYIPPYEVGTPVISVHTIGKVLKSDNAKIKVGDLVCGLLLETQSYSAVPESKTDFVQVLDWTPQDKIPLSAYLGALGVNGMSRKSRRESDALC